MNGKHIGLWDRWGVALSVLCLIHCLIIPFIALSIPMLARYYLMHPYTHLIFAILILPLGGFAFWHGYRHHHKTWVLILGLAGLLIVGLLPLFFHAINLVQPEPYAVSLGSFLLVISHWNNKTTCPGHC